MRASDSCNTSWQLWFRLRTSARYGQAEELLGEPKPGAAAPPDKQMLRLWYLLRAVEDVGAVLFDQRRRTCHSLVVNYWVAGGGLSALLSQLAHADVLFCPPDSGMHNSPSRPHILHASCIVQESLPVSHMSGMQSARPSFSVSKLLSMMKERSRKDVKSRMCGRAVMVILPSGGV